MKRIQTHAILWMVLLLTVVLISCRTGPKEIEEGLSKPKFFQRAQEAADNYQWDLALRYYQTFIERYPDDTASVFAARYEIAFIHYKMGDLEKAKKEFQTLLKDYQNTSAQGIPQWPRVLSEKLIKIIELKQKGVTYPALKLEENSEETEEDQTL